MEATLVFLLSNTAGSLEYPLSMLGGSVAQGGIITAIVSLCNLEQLKVSKAPGVLIPTPPFSQVAKVQKC